MPVVDVDEAPRDLLRPKEPAGQAGRCCSTWRIAVEKASSPSCKAEGVDRPGDGGGVWRSLSLSAQLTTCARFPAESASLMRPCAVSSCFLALTARAQMNPEWTTLLPPFQIADNLHLSAARSWRHTSSPHPPGTSASTPASKRRRRRFARA